MTCLNRYAIISLLTVGGLMSANAHADLYKCVQNGKASYQQTPCGSSGTQQLVDDTDSRRKAQSSMRESEADQDRTKKISVIKQCVADKDCETSMYLYLIKALKMAGYVEKALGKAESIQAFGTKEIHYYTVPTSDGRRKARLQITYSAGWEIESANAF